MSEPNLAGLVLAILNRRWDEAEAAAAGATQRPDRFVAVCAACDVAPWVHWLLDSHDRLPLIGTEAAALLAGTRHRLRRDNLLLLARAEEAVERLQRAGVTPVALKGLDLLARVYPQADLRTLDDVDLLVRREELPAALAALEDGGWCAPPEPARTHYVRSSHHLPLRSPGAQPVDFELHWNLVQEGRFRLDPAALFQRAEPLALDGRQVLRLADEDLAAHLLLHHFTHYFDRRLKWAVDLELMDRSRPLDWAAVAGRLRLWGATAAAGLSARHLRKTFPELIPRELLRALPVAAWRQALLAPLRSRHPLDLLRGTRNRRVQLWIAAVLLERPAMLPGWLLHRARRDTRAGENPLDAGPTAEDGEAKRG